MLKWLWQRFSRGCDHSNNIKNDVIELAGLKPVCLIRLCYDGRAITPYSAMVVEFDQKTVYDIGSEIRSACRALVKTAPKDKLMVLFIDFVRKGEVLVDGDGISGVLNKEKGYLLSKACFSRLDTLTVLKSIWAEKPGLNYLDEKDFGLSYLQEEIAGIPQPLEKIVEYRNGKGIRFAPSPQLIPPPSLINILFE